MKFFNWHKMGCLTVLALTFPSTPTAAHEQGQPQPDRLAKTAVGTMGQRQTREPMARISNRIANRIQDRIRNRIDRHYNPQANVTSPFEVAEERARNGNAQTPR